MKNKYPLILSILLLFVFCSSSLSFAVPAAPVLSELTQPDGTKFRVRTKGDEWRHWRETESGYSIMKDTATGWWHYAVFDEIYGMSIGPHRVGEGTPEHLGIKKGVRPVQKLFRKSSRAVSGHRSPEIEKTSGLPFTQNVVVILAEFDNYKHLPEDTEAAFNDLLFGNSPSVADYYNEVSYGRFNIIPAATNTTSTQGVIGWVSAGVNNPDCNDNMTCNVNIAKSAITAASKYINFADFDLDKNNVLTTDELAIVIVVAGYEAAYGNNSPSVWAHQNELRYPLVFNGVNIKSYAMFGERQGSHRATIGVMVHELGHLMLDLPDLYDTSPSKASAGIGPFDVMADGSWCKAVTDKYSGETPVHLSAWTKKFAGFIDPVKVTNQAGVEFLSVSGGTTNIVKIPAANSLEFFLIENRFFTGYDAGLQGCLNYPFPAGGLAIWHVDEALLDCRSSNDCENYASHKLVDLEEAGGYQDLEQAGGKGGLNDLFYKGNNNAFTPSTSPGSVLYQNLPSGISVTNISAYGELMTADIDVKSSVTPFTLSVEKSGTGSGTISASGLSCSGNACSGTYLPGTKLVLIATPDADSIFDGWSGGGCSGTDSCSLTVNSNAVIIANFLKESLKYKHNIRPLTRSLGPSGSTGSIRITTKPGSAWTALSNADWISITSGGKGTGNGKIWYSVSANTSPNEREGTITIEEKTFTIVQQGASDLSGSWTSASKKKTGLKYKVSGRLVITAIDNNAQAVRVKIYLSGNAAYDQTALFLGQLNFTAVKAGKSVARTFTYSKLDIDPAGRYLIAVIDPDNKITESDKNNNIVSSSTIP